MRTVPHFTTLQKASGRLLRQPHARRLFRRTVRRYFGRRRRGRRVASDPSGLDCGHASRYFIRRRARKGSPWRTVTYTRYAELEVAVDCASHVIVGVLAGRGPVPDVDRFVPLLDATVPDVRPARVVADAGYDSKPNHRYAWDRRGVASYIPPLLGRPTPKPPTGRYRRQMKQRLNQHYGGYGQRWQVETVFSMIKRNLAEAVAARSYWSQCRELWLLAITHNLMILYVLAGFLHTKPDPFLFPCLSHLSLALFSSSRPPESWSESRVRQNRKPGSRSGRWKRSTARLLSYRRTEGPDQLSYA